jgi:hypothetical protein
MNHLDRRILALALGLLVAIAGCGDDDDDNPTNPNVPGLPENGTMTCTIDGVPWTALAVQGANTGGIVGVGGGNAGGQLGIGLGFQGSSPDVYIIDGTNPTNGSVTTLGGTVWSSTSGTITVTELDAAHVAGTFSFFAQRTVGTESPETREVTDGVFVIEFVATP